MRGAILSPPVAEPDLLEAAARTLDAVPGAEAVLLYGSRARGSAMPDSDWDVAVVTREEFFLPDQYGRTPIEALHPSVNAIFLGTDLLRHKRNSPGHIAREVLRDGRLLAGRMPRVGRIKKNPPMEHQEFVAKSSVVVTALCNAGTAFARVLAATPIHALEGRAQDFVQSAANAAEYLAKLMMFRRGVMPPHWHDLNGLADCLESSDPDDQWKETVAAIRAMNGYTRKHHMAAYTGVNSADIAHATVRLQRVCKAFVDECLDASKDPGLRKAVDRQVAYLRQESTPTARELAAAEPAPLQSVAVMTEQLAAEYDDESLAREKADEAWKAGKAMRASLSQLRDLYDNLAQTEPPSLVPRANNSDDFAT